MAIKGQLSFSVLITNEPYAVAEGLSILSLKNSGDEKLLTLNLLYSSHQRNLSFSLPIKYAGSMYMFRKMGQRY